MIVSNLPRTKSTMKSTTARMKAFPSKSKSLKVRPQNNEEETFIVDNLLKPPISFQVKIRELPGDALVLPKSRTHNFQSVVCWCWTEGLSFCLFAWVEGGKLCLPL
jgi:hypothetical protein